MLAPAGYQPYEGTIWTDGRRAELRSPSDAIRAGIGIAFQNFMLICGFSVGENVALALLKFGAFLRVAEIRERLGEFGSRYGLVADPDAMVWQLSVGEQQMLAIGRGLMGNPRLLLVDEISLGLAPLVVQELYRVLRAIAAEGTTTLVVDQNVSQILPLAQRVYCLRKGAVSLEGRPAELTRARIAAAYFGL